MNVVPGDDLLRCISCGYHEAKKRASDDPSDASARFVYEVAKKVHETHFLGYCLRTIGEKRDSGPRTSGEWLVDACIRKNVCLSNPHHSGTTRFIDSIVFAMESESQTGTPEFNTDFAKLLHLNATVKLYLNGINQSKEHVCKYMKLRRKYVEAILRTTPHDAQFFFGFWPSPAKGLWKSIPDHLDKIRLWEWKNDKLSEVACGDGP